MQWDFRQLKHLDRPNRRFHAFTNGILVIGCLLSTVVYSGACRGDEQTSRQADKPAKRSWLEVEREITAAFDTTADSIDPVTTKYSNKFVIPVGMGSSIRPATSFQRIECKRFPHQRAEEVIVILDMRIERDYSISAGKASSFRLVRFVARDEGKELFAAIVAYFEKKKLPYDIIDRKKDPTEKPFDPDRPASGVF